MNALQYVWVKMPGLKLGRDVGFGNGEVGISHKGKEVEGDEPRKKVTRAATTEVRREWRELVNGKS